MAVYYVLGITFVVFALGLSAIGLTRENFPPTPRGGRAVMAVAGLISVVTFGVLLASTKREHPREEAAEKKAEAQAEEGGPGGPPAEGRGTVSVIEDEYSIELEDAEVSKPGSYTFDVANRGKVPHDLAVEGAGGEAKTPLIDGGKKARLEVDLATGEYKLFCTVPGHERLGMRKNVKVGA